MKKYIATLFLAFFSVIQIKAQTWQKLFNHADSLLIQHNFAEADKILESAKIAAAKEFGATHENYFRTLNKIGFSAIFSTQDKLSVTNLLNENEHKIKENIGENHIVYAEALQNLGFFYWPYNKGNNTALSEQFLTKGLDVIKKIKADSSVTHIRTLNTLATLYNTKSDLKNAELLFIKAHDIAIKKLGEQHVEYAAILNNMGIFYSAMGNTKETENCYKKALKIREKVLGKKHPNYAGTLNNLGLFYKSNRNIPEAIKYYQASIEIRKESVGIKHQDYAASLNNMALVYDEIGNFKLAEKYYLEAEKVWKESIGENPASYINLAILYKKTGQYKKALMYDSIALKLRKEMYGTNHKEYSSSLNNIAILYNTTKQYSKALPYFVKDLKIKQNIFLNNYVIMTENEKINYYLRRYSRNNAETNYTSTICYLQDKKQYKYITGDIYNNQLFSKGVLINSSQRIKKSILENNGDTTLINDYKKYVEIKNMLANIYILDYKKQKELKIDSLENIAFSIEKKLNVLGNKLSILKNSDTVKWQAIQKKLKKNEAAIEIVQLNKFGLKSYITDTFSIPSITYPQYALNDTIHYIALIIKQNSTYPELVFFENGNDLDGKYFNFLRNNISLKSDDYESFNKYWLPIHEKLKNINKVYFSPDGIFNKINLNILKNPKTNRYLLDEIEIHQVTSTKDILAFTTQTPPTTAYLIGRPIFEKKINNNIPSDALTSRFIMNIKDGIADLPNTEIEVNEISQMLRSQNIEVQSFILNDANEYQAKKVNNQHILHFATHSYFYPDSQSKLPPMLNSGLLLSGVVDYLKSDKKEGEDGLLSAFEIMNLNLSETQLVVMSACETGLGDIKSGLGVYGLQRAFKVAGAKSIIMSLWEVDDLVTQKLMTTFYKNWLKTHDIRQAFKSAELSIRKEYPSPYYWGAFIVLGQ